MSLIGQEEGELTINIEDLPNFKLAGRENLEEIIKKQYDAHYAKDPIKSRIQIGADFIRQLRDALKAGNLDQLLKIYDVEFNKLSDLYFRNQVWPSPGELEEFLDEELDLNTQYLYLELANRHVYARMSAANISAEVRVDSWVNYEIIFDIFTKENVTLPPAWVWDILDEFLYQFQAFCMYRAKMKEEDPNFQKLSQEKSLWNLEDVQKILKNLIDKSKILKPKTNIFEDIPSAKLTTLHYFGYYALVCQLRLGVMIGDYNYALKAIEPIDSKRIPIYSKAYAGYTSLFYYVGFCYLMKGRYREAVRIFEVLISFMFKYKQFYSKSFQFEAINKQADKSIYLLAIALLFYPTTIEENLQNIMKEECGERLERLNKYDLAAFQEFFNYGCPKFINPILTVDHFQTQGFEKVAEPMNVQRDLLLADFQKVQLLNNISSVLKLYSSIHLSKLAKVLKITDDEMKSLLEAFRKRNQISLADTPFESTIVSKFVAGASQIEFQIGTDGLVKISNASMERNYFKIFAKQSQKLEELAHALE